MVQCAAWSPDGKILASGAEDCGIWLLKDGKSIVVKSYFVAGDEVMYKDEDGKSHKLKKDDVEKFPQ